MHFKTACFGVATILGLSVSTGVAAGDLSDLTDRARTACAPQIEGAFSTLASVCTAAAVIDLALTPENTSCAVARTIVVEYLKSCAEHAAALIQEGGPVALPPFPDLGPALVDGTGRGNIPPMPEGWPGPFPDGLEQLPAMVAAIKHESLHLAAEQQLRVLLAHAQATNPEILLLDEPESAIAADVEVRPSDSSATSAADAATSGGN